ncbi:ABC transporter permease [Bombiscardovia coagulans]|uniref:SalY-type ABC antimicrobial peptide transport system permease component n=1 Tax=Bombiscardovia coagulans TaxID=686666 RepID=A0A261ET67_9BIFI|nr:FtsX-like permease family protein [Bombiscardovia coagulans]OZG50050.1 SalY-type ABC antimicrobial peptide transport system permease component [Bombiscardovia coagulans]
MWSISLRMMKKDSRMLIPAGIAVMVGTLFIAATFLFGNTLDRSFRQQISSNFGGANYALAPDDDQVAPLPAKDFHLDKVEAVQGVRGLRPDIFSSDVIISTVQGDKHSNTAVVVMSHPDSLLPISLVEGRWPQAESEVAIPKKDAEHLGVKIGGQVDISSEGGKGSQTNPQLFRLVGFTEDESGIYSYYSGACVLSKGALGRIAGLDAGKGIDEFPVIAVYLSLDPTQVGSQGMKLINGYLPKGYSLQTRTVYEDKQIKSLSGQTSIMTTFLLTFGVLAMFVAALVISNTFQVMVARQRRVLALLRTIGAKKSQVRSSVLMQSGILGLLSSILGTVLAIGMMYGVQLSKFKLSGVSLTLSVTPPVLIVPIAFGIVITMLASLSSASAATRVSPIEALRPAEISKGKRSGRIRLLAALVMILMGAAMAAYIVYQAILDSRGVKTNMLAGDQSQQAIGIAVMGVALAFVGILLCANRWIPWMLKGIGSIVSRCGPSSNVAVANISRNPSRVAATGTALLIGVTLVACLGTGASSAKQTLSNALDRKYSVDIEVILPKEDQQVLEKIRAVPGVKAAGNVAVYNVHISDEHHSRQSENKNSEDVLVYGLKAGQSQRLMNVNLESSLSSGSQLIVPKNKLGSEYKEGQRIKLISDDLSANGTPVSKSFQIVSGGFKGLSAQNNLYGVALRDQLEQFGSPMQSEIWVKSDGTQRAGILLDDIRQAVSSVNGANVAGAIAEKDMYERSINIILMVMVALLAVAVLIALIGVANTLSLSVIERTRESATLRAIGMTKKQLRRSLTVEALLIALSSCLVGLVLGTLFGWVGSYIVFESYGKVALPIDWTMYILIVLVAALAAYLASVLPARRATKTAPVEALAEA